MSDSSPHSIGSLLERMSRDGADALRDALGPYVLVGSSRPSDAALGWSFATHAVRPTDDGAAGEGGFDLEGSIVHGLRKRGSTFAGVILVGRASSNDVCIDDTTISKLHARIRVAGDCFWLEDAGSRNGTFVEGERVRAEAAVYAGDTVRFGTCVFRVHETGRFVDILSRMRGRAT